MEPTSPDPDESDERHEEFDHSGPEEVITDFGGVRLRSTFEVVEDSSCDLIFEIEGPIFEFEQEEDEDEGP